MLIGLKKPSRRIEKAKAETSSGKDGARARSRPDWARLSQHASHRRPPGETLAARRSRQRHGAMDRRARHRFQQGVSRHRRFSNAKCRDRQCANELSGCGLQRAAVCHDEHSIARMWRRNRGLAFVVITHQACRRIRVVYALRLHSRA
jgi:hypothetical protein